MPSKSVSFGEGELSGATRSIDISFSSEAPRNRRYLVSVYVEEQVGAPVAVTLENRVELGDQASTEKAVIAPIVPDPFFVVDPGKALGDVVEGWLVGIDPARATFTLTAAATQGGNVWLSWYAI